MNGYRPSLNELYQIGKTIPARGDNQSAAMLPRPPTSPPQLLGPFLPTDNMDIRSDNASTVPEMIPIQQISKPVPIQVTLPEQLVAQNEQYIQTLQNALQQLTTNGAAQNTTLSAMLALNAYTTNPYLGGLLSNIALGQVNPNPIGLNSAFSIVPGGHADHRPPNLYPTTTTSLNGNLSIQSTHGSAFVPPYSASSFLAMRHNAHPYYSLNGGLPMTNKLVKMGNIETSRPKMSILHHAIPKTASGNMSSASSSNSNTLMTTREPNTSNGFSNYEGPWCVPHAMTYHESVIKDKFARNNDCVKINMKANTTSKTSDNSGTLHYVGYPHTDPIYKSCKKQCVNSTQSAYGGDVFMKNPEFNSLFEKEMPIGSPPILTEPVVRQSTQMPNGGDNFVKNLEFNRLFDKEAAPRVANIGSSPIVSDARALHSEVPFNGGENFMKNVEFNHILSKEALTPTVIEPSPFVTNFAILESTQMSNGGNSFMKNLEFNNLISKESHLPTDIDSSIAVAESAVLQTNQKLDEGDTFERNLALDRMLDKEDTVPARVGSSPIVTEPADQREELEHPMFTPSPEPLRLVAPYLGSANPFIPRFMDPDPAISAFDFKANLVALYDQHRQGVFRDDVAALPDGLPHWNEDDNNDKNDTNENKRKATEDLEAPCKKTFKDHEDPEI